MSSMANVMRNDLEGARDLGVLVEIYLLDGSRLLTGLHHWPEDDAGWFSVYAPQSLGDTTTTRKVFVDQISSWIVTNVASGRYGT